MENYHTYLLFHILEKPRNNIFENLSYTDKERVKKAISDAILGTDMVQHNSMIEKFKQLVKATTNKNDGAEKVGSYDI